MIRLGDLVELDDTDGKRVLGKVIELGLKNWQDRPSAKVELSDGRAVIRPIPKLMKQRG